MGLTTSTLLLRDAVRRVARWLTGLFPPLHGAGVTGEPTAISSSSASGGALRIDPLLPDAPAVAPLAGCDGDHLAEGRAGLALCQGPAGAATSSSPRAEAVQEEASPCAAWWSGAVVERLLDDISDIWAGAVVIDSPQASQGLYSIWYADDGRVEHQVEVSELRPWVAQPDCLHDVLLQAALRPRTHACSSSAEWRPGALVERLLDDISDIWAGAIVVDSPLASRGIYSIQYADDGSLEHEVDGVELRPRKTRLDFPAEVWVYVARCMFEKEDLCTFETLARAAYEAHGREASRLWCASYHERFGRCGPRCEFKRLAAGPAASRATRASINRCVEAAAEGLTTIDRKPWKTRYIEQERLMDASRRFLLSASAGGSPGEVAYALCGKKLTYNHNPMSGFFFDPRLGRMVREC